MSSRPPDHLNGRREVAVAEAAATEAALEKLKPLLKPDKLGDARLVLTRTMSKVHSGPIPSAEEMEHLERVHPGSADRCFTMAEKEQAHRHECEKAIIDREFVFRGRGQWLAITAVICLLCAVGFIAYLGDTKSATVLGTATLVGLVYAFTKAKQIDAGEPELEPEPQSGKSGKRPQKR
ncbi:DUF2335 domain-containing protein [Sphingomonas profundi]|uniref:DUF2335 domain-containing protein n=1 Tax=Alterirhizorhabdus profundi TaxID=2681549 RepID=UPI0012E8358F|nr:DUF2335 domain-containing protein [Sphingomonas profundi]